MMDINIWAVIVCAVVAQGLGFVWYGPLFGDKYARIIGGKTKAEMSDEECKEMNKKMGPVYALNFIMGVITVLALACVFNHYIVMGADAGIKTALALWFGFVMPMHAGMAMWSGKPKKMAWNLFLISTGYQAVAFAIFGAILGAWM
jgi:hypothetical protein